MSDSDPENSTDMIYEYIQDNTTEQESTDAYGYSIKLEEITVSASATTENINHAFHLIFLYKIGMCPFYVNQCYVTNSKNPFCPNFCHCPKKLNCPIFFFWGGAAAPLAPPPGSYAHGWVFKPSLSLRNFFELCVCTQILSKLCFYTDSPLIRSRHMAL